MSETSQAKDACKQTEWGPFQPLASSAKRLDKRFVHPVLLPWIEDVAERAQAPYEAVLVPIISSLGNIVARRLLIEPKLHDDWHVRPNLWAMLIGPPSLKKSYLLNQGSILLKLFQSEAEADFKKARSDRLAKLQILERRKKNIEDQMSSSTKEEVALGESELLTLEYSKVLEEIDLLSKGAPVFYTTDTTPQKLVRELVNNPVITVLNDELSGWFQALESENRIGERQFFLKGWTGFDSHRYSTVKDGAIYLENYCLSVCGCIQPQVLKRIFQREFKHNESTDGALQRFQLIYSVEDDPNFLLVDRKPNNAAKEKIIQAGRKILKADFPNLEKTSQGLSIVKFEKEAQILFSAWLTDNETRVRSNVFGSPAMQAHMAKFNSLMPSIALIYGVLDWVSGVSTEIKVSLASARAAAEFCEFEELQAANLYLGHQRTPAGILLEKIRTKTVMNGWTIRDILQKNWSGLSSESLVTAAVNTLQSHNYVKLEDRPSTQAGGRPTRHLSINPEFLNG